MFLPPATKLGQAYVFTLVVILFTGGSAPLHAGIHPPRSRHPPSQEQIPPMPMPRDQEPRPPEVQCMLGDTANKRAVRILLECNLVLWEIYLHQTQYFEVLNRKGCKKVVVECCYNKDNMRYNPLAFVASFELEFIPVVG